MESYINVLRPDEIYMLRLRSLYEAAGYGRFFMSKFEKYDLYAQNKSFLTSSDVITFNDRSGNLMALKPDVTLSIVKNIRDGADEKVYYTENVYRLSGGDYKEIMQVGVENIGNTDIESCGEVIRLAYGSLELLGRKFVLDISHMGMVQGLIEAASPDGADAEMLLSYIKEKNIPAVKEFCAESGCGSDKTEKLIEMMKISGRLSDNIEKIKTLIVNEKTYNAAKELEDLSLVLGGIDAAVDFSAVNDLNYYSGVIFRGFVEGVHTCVLSGGRYDNLLKKLGKSSGAVGFAVYMNYLEGIWDDNAEQNSGEYINIALPKGRLGEKAYGIFEKIGFGCPDILSDNRKLIFENPENKVRFFWAKPSDVAIYVERGAADIGIVGKDILLESSPDIYELLDLKMGRCRMAVAGKKGRTDSGGTLRVATKFPNIAKNYFNSKSREIDIIKLNGSIEIAPILGLSDVIVDIVETGKTLYENNLEPKETIVDISARLVANKAAYRFKSAAIELIRTKMQEEL